MCDLGFLRQGYRKANGTVGCRCPGEPVKSYVHKGGEIEDAVGRKCVCNGLLASIGMEQHRRNDQVEKPLVTCGNDVASITQFLKSANASSYTAADVVKCLVSGVRVPIAIV